MKKDSELTIFQAENGSIEIRTDVKNATVWLSQSDLSILFEKDQSVISRHIKSIFRNDEVDKKSNMQKIHIANSDKPVAFYSLDIVLSVGYRTNSAEAINFRKWATKTLKQHITKGYTLNQNVLESNKAYFLQTLENLKILNNHNRVETKDILSLIQSFSDTFFTLESYDKNNFIRKGEIMEVTTSAKALRDDLQILKKELIKKGEATELFAQEKNKGNLEGVFGSVFQSVFGKDAYPTIEEKAAHLLYFIVKNHLFNDGNKRSGAFAFIWLLQKANYNFTDKISPKTLSTLTLLIAISLPEEKDKIIGLVLLLMNTKN